MKMKRLGIFIVLSLLVSMLIGCQPQFQSGTYTDDMGREVRIDKVPQRIVSLAPSHTEILFALGLGQGFFSSYPVQKKIFLYSFVSSCDILERGLRLPLFEVE